MRARTAAAVAMAFLLALGAVLLAGCGSSPQQKMQGYKDQWTKIMDPFETRIEKDDLKANDLVAKNDLAAVITLLKARMANVDVTFDKVATLKAPPEMRNLHAITLFYLYSVMAQLKAQNNLNEAIRTGQPAEDLSKIADNAKARTVTVTRELILELEQNGIKLKVMKNSPGQQQGSAPSSSPPASSGSPQ